MLTPWKESYDQPRQHIKKQRHYFVNKGPSSQGYGFSSNHVWMWELEYKESWALKNWCFWTVVLEKTPESSLDCKEIHQSILKEISLNIHWRGWYWSWNSNTSATWCKELTHLRRPWYWERLRAGEGDDRGWDGLMALLTPWTWVWVSSGSRWWTGRPGVLQSMGSQRVRHDWVTELKWLTSLCMTLVVLPKPPALSNWFLVYQSSIQSVPTSSLPNQQPIFWIFPISSSKLKTASGFLSQRTLLIKDFSQLIWAKC